MNGKPKTDREEAALRFIRDYVAGHGYPPSQRELAAELGWASASDAHFLLRLLAEKGLITVTPGIPRGIAITGAGMVALTEPV